MDIFVNGIEADKPTITGRIYPLEVLEEAARKVKNRNIPICIYSDPETAKNGLLKDAVGYVKDVKVENNKLKLSCSFPVALPNNKILQEIGFDNIEIAPIMSARVNEDKVVTLPATILSFTILPKEK